MQKKRHTYFDTVGIDDDVVCVPLDQRQLRNVFLICSVTTRTMVGQDDWGLSVDFVVLWDGHCIRSIASTGCNISHLRSAAGSQVSCELSATAGRAHYIGGKAEQAEE